ncbi:MAG TPA: extensin family protein [Rhodoblastus sp.]|nr:extensin family protein [Rhodoblastus sp.]
MQRAIILAAAFALQAAPALAETKDRPGAPSPFSQMDRPAPQPPPRPADLLSYAPEPPARDPSLPRLEADAACQAVLADANLVTEVRPPISGDGGCGIAAPVSLVAVILQDKRRIEISPAPVMRCDLAARLGAFVRETLAPATEFYGRRIKRVATADAYDCRTRNRQFGAKLSEHALGGAVDLSGIEFTDGSTLRLTDKRNDLAVATAIKDSACARFTTVLGPGSDGYHEDHIHLDLAQRRNGYKICQWVLR